MKKILLLSTMILTSFYNLKSMEISEKKELPPLSEKKIETPQNKISYATLLEDVEAKFLPDLANLIINRLKITFLTVAEQAAVKSNLDNPILFGDRFNTIKVLSDCFIWKVQPSNKTLDLLNKFDKQCEKKTQFNYSLISLFLDLRKQSTSLIKDLIKEVPLIYTQIDPISNKSHKIVKMITLSYPDAQYRSISNIVQAFEPFSQQIKNQKGVTTEGDSKILAKYKKLDENIKKLEKINKWAEKTGENFLTNKSTLRLLDEFNCALTAILEKAKKTSDFEVNSLIELIEPYTKFLQSFKSLLKNDCDYNVTLSALKDLENFATKFINCLQPPSKKQCDFLQEKNIGQYDHLPTLIKHFEKEHGRVQIFKELNCDCLTDVFSFLISRQILWVDLKKDNPINLIMQNNIIFSPFYNTLHSFLCKRMKEVQEKNLKSFLSVSKKSSLKKQNPILKKDFSSEEKSLSELDEPKEKPLCKLNENEPEETPENDGFQSYTKQDLQKMLEYNTTTQIDTEEYLILFRSWSSDTHGHAVIVIKKSKQDQQTTIPFGNFKTIPTTKKDMFHKVVRSILSKSWLFKHGRLLTFNPNECPKNLFSKYGIKSEYLKEGDHILYFPGFMFTGLKAKQHFDKFKEIALSEKLLPNQNLNKNLNNNNDNMDTKITSYIKGITNDKGMHYGAGVCAFRPNNDQPLFLFHSCYQTKEEDTALNKK